MKDSLLLLDAYDELVLGKGVSSDNYMKSLIQKLPKGCHVILILIPNKILDTQKGI